ncbi:MAG: hypothetical protein AAFN77_04785 [Planctomycetota bacterium]
MEKFELPKFNRDIESPWLLKVKGLAFAVIGLLSAGILMWQLKEWTLIAMLIVSIWAWCRFYYFLFYVLEHYAGRKRPYAGIFDALTSIFRNEK